MFDARQHVDCVCVSVDGGLLPTDSYPDISWKLFTVNNPRLLQVWDLEADFLKDFFESLVL